MKEASWRCTYASSWGDSKCEEMDVGGGLRHWFLRDRYGEETCMGGRRLEVQFLGILIVPTWWCMNALCIYVCQAGDVCMPNDVCMPILGETVIVKRWMMREACGTDSWGTDMVRHAWMGGGWKYNSWEAIICTKALVLRGWAVPISRHQHQVSAHIKGVVYSRLAIWKQRTWSASWNGFRTHIIWERISRAFQLMLSSCSLCRMGM